MAKLSTAPFNPDPAAYTDEEWQRACVLDKGAGATVKARFALPVRDHEGALNAAALRKASEELPGAEAHELAKDAARAKLTKQFAKAGLPARVAVAKSKLTGKQRAALPASDFIFPDTREYPYPDEAHARDALSRGAENETGKRLATIRSMVKSRYADIDVTKNELGLSLTVPVWKDAAKQIVYGVALTPGLIDSQGDIVSAEEIEKAAHRFLTEYRKHDVQHNETPAAVETVESFVAPQDMEIAGQPILKGSWVLGVHVADPDTWARVQKGEISGFSIGGTGERIPIAA